MWRKANFCTQLVGMQVGAVTVKDRVEVPLENKKQIPYDPAIPLLGIDPEKNWIIKKCTCMPMFTGTLFTIAKPWKQMSNDR